MEHDEEIPPTNIDWESRTLCVDETCIGVIGNDGRCKECGKPLAGEQKEDLPSTHKDESSYENDPVEVELAHEEGHAEDEEDESASDIDWENRTLCVDESCIGVIGNDGRCKECGKGNV